MASERRKRILIYMMAAMLVLTIPGVYLRLSACIEQMPPREIIEITGVQGTILDREGNVIYNEKGATYDEYINLVAAQFANGNHVSYKTLAYQYKDELLPKPISVVAGTSSFEGLKGMELHTTLLPGTDLQTLNAAFKGYNGCVFAYNYKTGQIYVMLSLPSNLKNLDTLNNPLFNRNLGSYMPGSCFKVVTALCALTQDPELQNHTHTCTGSYTLADGNEVTCVSTHGGPLNMTDALGRSCNCYFASLIGKMDVEQTCQILRQLGIRVGEEETDEEESDGKEPAEPAGVAAMTLDRFSRDVSYTSFDRNNFFGDTWNMIGEIGTMMSPMDLTFIGAAIVNDGAAAAPYLIESSYDPNDGDYNYKAEPGQMHQLVDPAVSATLKGIWSDAVDRHYRDDGLDPRITFAKTGTSEIGKANNRLILGVMEEYDTAFLVVVEELPSGDPLIIRVANVLADMIPAP